MVWFTSALYIDNISKVATSVTTIVATSLLNHNLEQRQNIYKFPREFQNTYACDRLIEMLSFQRTARDTSGLGYDVS
ncbi:hypothetical protein, partial [Photobacterium alginatilyticum]|uniref:hypothetical protein n=1 Tax=Photobacterium alginatilyticum TaxID=1775171 RepID=UPI0019657903